MRGCESWRRLTKRQGPNTPCPGRRKSRESFGRDPDDGEHDVVEALRLADDFWIALEAGLPKTVADHHDRMRVAAAVFASLKAAAQ